MILVSSCICLCPIHLSREWRCSWSSADRRCSVYIWVINNLIACKGVSYIRDLTVTFMMILWMDETTHGSQQGHTIKHWNGMIWNVHTFIHKVLFFYNRSHGVTNSVIEIWKEMVFYMPVNLIYFPCLYMYGYFTFHNTHLFALTAWKFCN